MSMIVIICGYLLVTAMPNSKRCCTHCKTSTPTTEGITAGLMFFCDDNCRRAYGIANAAKLASKAIKQRISKTKEREKQTRQAVRALNRKSESWQLDRTQDAFNRMRRLEELEWFYIRGLKPTCISCGQPLGNDQWCCGHMKSVGSNSRLRFSRINTHLQHNYRCNQNLSGDIAGTSKTHGYHQGLVNRFGEERANRIIQICERQNKAKKMDM